MVMLIVLSPQSQNTPMSRGVDSPPPAQPDLTPDDDPIYFNSEFILFIGLFIIFCFLICLIGLNACTCIRRFSDTLITTNPVNHHFSLQASKLLRSIPKLNYCAESMADKSSDCAICLTEFEVGDEIRVIPMCGHCFHVACVDRWIGSHFTCPSCRQMLLKTTRCNNGDVESTITGETRGLYSTTVLV